MAREDILFRQSVAILVDGNNIERSIHNLTGNTNSMVNFDTLVPRLLNGRALTRFIYFREGRSISEKLAQRLHENYYGVVVPCHKSADIPLTIFATQIADKVDTIIILSGDSDYVELVRHLRSRGVRVEIASVEETTADILRKESDYWHPIVKADCFELKATTSSSRKTTTKKPTPRKTTVSKKENTKQSTNKSTSSSTKKTRPSTKSKTEGKSKSSAKPAKPTSTQKRATKTSSKSKKPAPKTKTKSNSNSSKRRKPKS